MRKIDTLTNSQPAASLYALHDVFAAFAQVTSLFRGSAWGQALVSSGECAASRGNFSAFSSRRIPPAPGPPIFEQPFLISAAT